MAKGQCRSHDRKATSCHLATLFREQNGTIKTLFFGGGAFCLFVCLAAFMLTFFLMDE